MSATSNIAARPGPKAKGQKDVGEAHRWRSGTWCECCASIDSPSSSRSTSAVEHNHNHVAMPHGVASLPSASTHSYRYLR